MNNKLTLKVLAGTLMFVAGTGVAIAENKSYFGVQYGYGDYDEDVISETFDSTLLIGRFGRFLTPNFSIEGRLGLGLEDDTHNLTELGNRDATLEIETLFGIYGTGHINITESSSMYGVLGVSKVKGKASIPIIPGLESTENNSSVSYGIGADIGIGSSWALNIEYIRYLDKDDFDFDVGSVGASFSF